MSNKFKVLTDEKIEKEVRYLSFMGNFHRYDFAIMDARQPGETLIIDLNKNRFAELSENDLIEEGVIEHKFHVTEIEADELREFLKNTL